MGKGDRRKIHIVMATRNAGSFLDPQIESIQKQTYSNWALWVRDDDSRDGTAERLEEWAADARIHLMAPGRRKKGAAHAFFDALLSVPKDADYFAFCDQDDIWLPSKLELSVKELEELEAANPNVPCLVHSDMRVVNESLEPIADSFFKYQGLSPGKRNNLKDLLVQNHVTGCTILFNRPLLERTLKREPLDSVCMHDWWIALVAAASGHIRTINRPLVLYRQHERNDTGAKEYSLAKELLSFLRNPNYSVTQMRSALDRTRKQAHLLLDIHGDLLNENNLQLLKRYSALGHKAPLQRRLEMLSLRVCKSKLSMTVAMYLFV